MRATDGAARTRRGGADDSHQGSRLDQLVIEEWRRHIAPWRSLEELEEATARHAAAVRALDDAARAARDTGALWADIGRATGMTRQSANERWAPRLRV